MAIADENVPAATRLLAAFKRCRQLLCSIIGQVVKPQDIEDILQETFVRTYVASQTTEIRHPVSFMLKTARNLALNQAASAFSTRVQHTEDFAESMVYTTEGLESQVEARQKFIDFCRAVRELPVQCRRVFILKKVYGLSQREISEHLGISESTVEKHVAKGVLMCMRAMRAMGHLDGEQTSPDAKRQRGQTTHE